MGPKSSGFCTSHTSTRTIQAAACPPGHMPVMRIALTEGTQLSLEHVPFKYAREAMRSEVGVALYARPSFGFVRAFHGRRARAIKTNMR